MLAEDAIQFIEDNKAEPFFIYWSPNAVHTPMEATEEDLNKYKDHPRQQLAAMTYALDRAIGSMVKILKDENLFDNTIIFFLSDNGGATTNQSSNLPLKGFKGNKYEGGHRIPFFVHWPKVIKTGSSFDGLTSSLDIFATCEDIVSNKEGSLISDGVSLLPLLKGNNDNAPHGELYWRKEGMAASRLGDYKMIRVDSLGTRLYNLSTDLQEEIDLSSESSDRLEAMKSNLLKWESNMLDPLWIESAAWNRVTWYIHQDLFHNRPVSVKSPMDLK